MSLAHEPNPWPLSRAEYDELVQRGVFDDARVELLYGHVVAMSPLGKPHAYSVTSLVELLIQLLAGERASADSSRSPLPTSRSRSPTWPSFRRAMIWTTIRRPHG